MRASAQALGPARSRSHGRAGADGGAHRRVTAADEAGQAGLELPSLQQDMAAAALAAQADVGAESIDLPLAAAAGMGSAKPHEVAEEQLEHGPAGHRRERTSIGRPDPTAVRARQGRAPKATLRAAADRGPG